MRILAYGSGHDGSIVSLEDGRLSYSIESEKDSEPRYMRISPTLFLRSLQFSEPPDVVAQGLMFKASTMWSWSRVVDNASLGQVLIETGYADETHAGKNDSETVFAGRRVRYFSSSHVRSHIMCGYGLSPFPQGQPCYALIWEGLLGGLYYVDEQLLIRKVGDVLDGPGGKYSFLYALADPSVHESSRYWERLEDAGKLMALAAYGRRGEPTQEERETIELILSLGNFELRASRIPVKSKLSNSKYFNIGVETQELKDLAWQLSNALFDRFYHFAHEHVRQKVPLLISGGCGLNCEWNTQWQQCGLFSDVFVPPCANDSGIGIGAAIDAQHHYTGSAKVNWSVYAGEPFVEDVIESDEFEPVTLNLAEICKRLLNEQVIAWVQGHYEMGPRALGNRSLLAAPFSPATRDRLNRIKQREPFRPIAPICLEEDFTQLFDHHGPSPYMLHFQRVKSAALGAVTHVDGSARAQSVNDRQNPLICDLLREFRRQSGVAVLCNTSLNFKGFGFINRLSHLFAFARERSIDGLVVGTRFWRPKATAH